MADCVNLSRIHLEAQHHQPFPQPGMAAVCVRPSPLDTPAAPHLQKAVARLPATMLLPFVQLLTLAEWQPSDQARRFELLEARLQRLKAWIATRPAEPSGGVMAAGRLPPR